jgi:hypothetical protein
MKLNISPQKINIELKKLRQHPVARTLYCGCGVGGFVRGFNVSKFNKDKKERLITDRLSWGLLYAGLYTYLHPFMVYHLAQEIEVKTKSKTINKYAYNKRRAFVPELVFPVLHS